jgi:hypothetical protein
MRGYIDVSSFLSLLVQRLAQGGGSDVVVMLPYLLRQNVIANVFSAAECYWLAALFVLRYGECLNAMKESGGTLSTMFSQEVGL